MIGLTTPIVFLFFLIFSVHIHVVTFKGLIAVLQLEGGTIPHKVQWNQFAFNLLHPLLPATLIPLMSSFGFSTGISDFVEVCLA